MVLFIDEKLGYWLLEQVPVVVVMGVVIVVLFREYKKKDKEVAEMSQHVIKLATLYEVKADEMKLDEDYRKEILEGINEIKDYVRSIDQ